MCFFKTSPNSLAIINVDFLLDKVLVVTVPGVEFGMEGFLRISFCGSVEDITEGIDRIKWALDPGSSKELLSGDKRVVKDWI